CNDGERQLLRPRIETERAHLASSHGERLPAGSAEDRKLSRREAARIEVREGVALEGRTEVARRGVGRSQQRQRRAEIRAGIDALRFGHAEGPARRKHALEQRHSALDIQSLVQRVRLLEQLRRAVRRAVWRGTALRDQRKARDHAERENDDELPHGRAPSRLVRAIRPRDRVWPTVTVMVVSKAW